jgi:methyl-accepting chemotaxis protein
MNSTPAQVKESVNSAPAKSKSEKDTSVSTRIRVGTLLLALVPLVGAVAALTIWNSTSDRFRTQTRIQEQLSSLRQVKSQQIQDYFENYSRLMLQTASTPATVDAAKALTASFAPLKTRSEKNLPALKTELKSYYAGPFAQEYNKRTGAAPEKIADLVDRLPDETVVAQHLYISSNPKQLGKKGELDQRDDGSEYSKAHGAFHPTARSLVEKFGLYDFFLVDPSTGYVVYTYFKEIDFGTSLVDGPYSKTPLGEAFQAVRKASKADQVWLTDFATYFPSYEDQATFMSVPIFEGTKIIAVAIVQVPIDQINQLMSFNKQWEASGLGKTGESYLVGSDSSPRSIARGMAEKPEAFVNSLKNLLPEPALKAIAASKSDIGLRKLESEGIKQSLAGTTGSQTYENYAKQEVIGSFAPVQLLNQKFGLLVESGKEEAFATLTADLYKTLFAALGLLVLVAATAVYFARKISTSVTEPLNVLQGTVLKLQNGDFNARTGLVTTDEFGTLGKQFDKLLDERLSSLQEASMENERLNNSVVDIMQAVGNIATTKDLTARVPVAEDLTGAIADAMNLLNEETGRVLGNVARVSKDVATASEALRAQSDIATNASVREQAEVDQAARELGQAAQSLGMIAERATVCNESAERAVQSTKESLAIVNLTVEGVAASRELIRETEKRIKRLGERSQEISQVVGIIQNIAERTGILALNASMHAASAGEAGRSFSMVADEVKRLSESARDSTSQISRLISAIQNETKETVVTMNQAITQVVEINRLADEASAGMVRTQQETNALADNVRSISNTSREQARAGASLIDRARMIQEASAETARQLSAQADETRRLTEYSRSLIDEVSVFKLPQ